MKYPNNKELEYLTLSSMMNDEDCFYHAITNTNDDFFYHEESKEIYNQIVMKKGQVSSQLLIKEAESPERKILIDKISELFTDYDDYVEAVETLREYRNKRKLLKSLEHAQKRFESDSYDTLTDRLSLEMLVEDNPTDKDNIIDPTERSVEALEEFYEKLSNPDIETGLKYIVDDRNGRTTGFPSLQESLNGGKGGDLIMIAAKTGVGKTAFGVNLARLFSLQQNYAGYYQNVEMRKEEIEGRLLAPLANVKVTEITESKIEGTKEERDIKVSRIGGAFDKYRQSKLYTSVIPDLTISKSIALAKRIDRQKGIDYMIVDYIQRMQEMGSNESPWDQLFNIAKQLKIIAQTLDIPVYILAQRNDAGDVEGAKKMMNECDAVLYFEPFNRYDDKEKEIMQNTINPDKWDKVNYKIIKRKVRRDNNNLPIYCAFDKTKNYITEVR